MEVPVPEGDDWPTDPMYVRRTISTPAGMQGRNGSQNGSSSNGAAVHSNTETHWWDGSQIYATSKEKQDQIRTFQDGKLKIGSDGRLLEDPDQPGLDMAGFNENFWFGLSCLHTLFTKEHNAICDVLKRENPRWDDQRLFDTAWLIYSGIMGSPQEHHEARFQLTEEFVSVYRMHPLIRDDYNFFSHETGRKLGEAELDELHSAKTRPFMENYEINDLIYSMGVEHPGAIVLHNYPRALQRHRRIDGELMDLATMDVLRDRERGIPRYNDFREEMRMPRMRSFEELTPNKQWAEEIRRVYRNNIDDVDLQVGMYAEPLPPGFGFSDTAFRVFILMASRRLKSDRFFTTDFRPEVYTQTGIDWVNKTKMKDVILRHYPELEPALDGLPNAFLPWNKVDGSVGESRVSRRFEGTKKALAAINHD